MCRLLCWCNVQQDWSMGKTTVVIVPKRKLIWPTYLCVILETDGSKSMYCYPNCIFILKNVNLYPLWLLFLKRVPREAENSNHSYRLALYVYLSLKEFEDTKGVNRFRKLKKDRQHNGQKKKDKQRSKNTEELKIEQHGPH